MKTFFKWMWKGIKLSGLWFVNFFKGVYREIRRIRWPDQKQMTENTVTVVVFSAFFALFFSACYTIGQAVLRALEYFD